MTSYKADALFCKVYPLVLHVEGGYSNDPKDPGGPTMFGIAWNYNAGALKPLGITCDTMQHLTKDQALQIYYDKYWLASAAERITDEGLAYLHLDTAVNCGVGEAATIIKQLSFDAHTNYSRLQFLQLVHEYEALRLEYYDHLRPDLRTRYLEGWLNRMKYVTVQAAKLPLILLTLAAIATPANAGLVPDSLPAGLVMPTKVTPIIVGHVNAASELKALVRTDREKRSWKSLKLKPGKIYRWHYEYVLEDGSTVTKIERAPVASVQDDRPFSQTHPNLYIFSEVVGLFGSTAASSAGAALSAAKR